MSVTIPKELRYSEEKRQTAQRLGKFVRVGGKSTTYRKLESAKDYWNHKKTPDNDIYVIPLRLSGPENSVRLALQYNGATPQQINEYVSQAVTRANIDSVMRQAFDQAVAADKLILQSQVRKVAKADAPLKYSTDFLLGLYKGTRDGTYKIEYEDKPEVYRAKSTRAAIRVKGIEERIHKLAQGKVFDVSDMTFTGAGIHTVDAPKELSRSRKFYIAGVPLISYSLDNYLHAYQRLYPNAAASEFEQIKQHWAQHVQRTGGGRPAPRAKSGKAKGTGKGKGKGKTATKSRGQSRATASRAGTARTFNPVVFNGISGLPTQVGLPALPLAGGATGLRASNTQGLRASQRSSAKTSTPVFGTQQGFQLPSAPTSFGGAGYGALPTWGGVQPQTAAGSRAGGISPLAVKF